MSFTEPPLIFSRDEHRPILSLDDWSRWCRIQPDMHWKDGFSAKECAKAWFRNGYGAVPAELTILFGLHPLTANMSVTEVVQELRTKLDAYSGKGRCHDVIMRGHSSSGRVLVSVEAKGMETFGDTIGRVYDRSRAKSRSTSWRSIEGLVLAIFGRPIDDDIRRLRHQLITAFAGTLIQAQHEQAALAILIVHEFVRNGVAKAANQDDMIAFVQAIGGSAGNAIPRSGPFLSGPYAVPGGGSVPAHIPLLIGKASAASG